MRVSSVFIILLYVIAFQDLFVSFLLYCGLPALLLKPLLLIKEILVLGFGSRLLLSPRVSTGRFLWLVFIVYCLFVLFAHYSDYQTSLIGFRTYILLFLSFVIGEHIGSNQYEYQRIMKNVTVVFFLVAFFSFMEFFILPMSIWKAPFPIMEMKRVVGNMNTANEYYDFGYPVNAMGELTRRLLGPFNEPLYMAYFTIIILNFYFVEIFHTSSRPISKVIAGISMLFLTQTRAIILGLMLSLLAFILVRNKLRKKDAILILGAVMLLVSVSLLYWNWTVTLLNSIFDTEGRNIGHIDAYFLGVKTLTNHPFGLGIGTASSSVGFSTENLATENAFLNIGIETGVTGLLVFVLTMSFLGIRFYRNLQKGRTRPPDVSSKIVSVGFLLFVQFIFAGLVAPHILTARILIPFMIIMGWSYSLTNKKQ